MPGPYSSSDSRHYVGLGKQVARGTGVAPTLFAAFTTAVDLDHAQEINGLREAGGGGQITLAEKMSHMPTGGFEVRTRPSLAGKLFAYLLGADAISGLGPYDHALTYDSNTDYLSIEQNFADELTERFIDCVLSEVTFELSNTDSFMGKITTKWLGGRPTVVGAPTAETYETETPFVLANGVYTVDGTVRSNIRRIRLTLTVRYASDKLSDVVAEYQTKLGLDVTGEIEQLGLDIKDEYRIVQYGTTTGVAHTTTPKQGSLLAALTYGAGAAARGLTFNIPTLDYGAAVYTPLDPSGDSVKVVRPFTGRVAGGAAIATVTAKTSDSAAYVV